MQGSIGLIALVLAAGALALAGLQMFGERAESPQALADRVQALEEEVSDLQLVVAEQMDPTEVQDVEGSPWKQLEGRIKERARDLGADIPDDER